MRNTIKISSIIGLFFILFYYSSSKVALSQNMLDESAIKTNVPVEIQLEKKSRKHNYMGNIIDKPLYGKEVFLTFDDGPSINNTLKILEILKNNDVKATFFVIGKNVQSNPMILKLVNQSGMCILPHSQTHDYVIYKNLLSYMEDLDACIASIESITQKKTPHFTRFPGGSDNLVSTREGMKLIRNEVKNKGILYVDWNVSSADASAEKVPMSKIKDNVIKQCSAKKISVVLMHDSYPKTTSVEALPYIIKYLKDNGYVFRTFDDLTPTEEKEMIREGVINR